MVKHERLCNDHDGCHVEMPNEDKKNIKIQPWRKFIKSSVYDLCRLRMFAKKNASLLK